MSGPGHIALWLCAALTTSGQLDPPLQVPLNTDPRFVPIVQELEYMLNSIVELMKNHEDRAGFCRGMRYGYDRVSALDVSQEQNTAWALKQVRDEILHLCSSGTLKTSYLPQHIDMMKRVLHAYLSSIKNEAKRQDFLKRQADGFYDDPNVPQGLPQVNSSQLLYAPGGLPVTAADYQEATEPLLEPLPAEEEAAEERLEDAEKTATERAAPAVADPSTEAMQGAPSTTIAVAGAVQSSALPAKEPQPLVAQPVAAELPTTQLPTTQKLVPAGQWQVVAVKQSMPQPRPAAQSLTPQPTSSPSQQNPVPLVEQPQLQSVAAQLPTTQLPAAQQSVPAAQWQPNAVKLSTPQPPSGPSQQIPVPLVEAANELSRLQAVIQPPQVPVHLQAAAAAEQEAAKRGADAARAEKMEQLHVAEEKARVKVQAAEERLQRARQRIRLRKERQKGANAAAPSQAAIPVSMTLSMAIPVQAAQAEVPAQTQPEKQVNVQPQPQAQQLPQQAIHFHTKPLAQLPPLLQPQPTSNPQPQKQRILQSQPQAQFHLQTQSPAIQPGLPVTSQQQQQVAGQPQLPSLLHPQPMSNPQLQKQRTLQPQPQPQPQAQLHLQPQLPAAHPGLPLPARQQQQVAGQPQREVQVSQGSEELRANQPGTLTQSQQLANQIETWDRWSGVEEQPKVAPTRAPLPKQQKPPAPSADAVAAELLRQGDLMKRQYDAMAAQVGRYTPRVAPHSNSSVAKRITGAPRLPSNFSRAGTIAHAAARKALYEFEKENAIPVSPAASAVQKALDERKMGQFNVASSSDANSSDALNFPVDSTEQDAAHIDKLQQLINRLHKRTSKDKSKPAKLFNKSPPTSRPPSDVEHHDRILEVERRSRASLESFIHNADDLVNQEQYDMIKAKQDAKERVQRREQLKLSLRDLGTHPVNTDMSAALDTAMVSESMGMPGSFMIR